MDKDLRASLAAGAIAGLAGLLVFTLLHVVLVAPLWSLLLVGLLPALVGGWFVGWGYHELLDAGRLPKGPLRGPAFGALMWLTLVPLEVLALLRGPVPGLSPAEAMRALGPEVLLAGLAGALAAWLLTRAWRPTLAMGLAALLLAAPVAGTLLAFGGAGLGPALFAGMLLVDVVAGAVLAGLRPRIPGASSPRTATA